MKYFQMKVGKENQSTSEGNTDTSMQAYIQMAKDRPIKLYCTRLNGPLFDCQIQTSR